MRERAIQFGPQRGLVGIVTTPDSEGDRSQPKRALIVANVGLHHRVGPYRLYVELARCAAAHGLITLRFDLSGLGDSSAQPGAMSDTERGVLDMNEAMSFLESKLGVREFVIIALCSGVDVAHRVALQDPRIVGAIFIDGYTYPTVRSKIWRYTGRYMQLARWKRFISRLRARRNQARDATAGAVNRPVFLRDWPTLPQFRADIAAMVSRDVRLLFIWTGTYVQHNSRAHLFEMLGRGIPRAGIDVEHMGTADHVFMALGERARLIDRITTWLVARRSPAATK